jgi:hypothetical protein
MGWLAAPVLNQDHAEMGSEGREKERGNPSGGRGWAGGERAAAWRVKRERGDIFWARVCSHQGGWWPPQREGEERGGEWLGFASGLRGTMRWARV